MIKFINKLKDKCVLKKERTLKIKEIESIFKDKTYNDVLYNDISQNTVPLLDLDIIKKDILDNNYIINKVRLTKQIETEHEKFIDVDYLPIERGRLKERIILPGNEFLYFEGHSSFYRFKFNREDQYVNNGQEIISKNKEMLNVIVVYQFLNCSKNKSPKYSPILIVK